MEAAKTLNILDEPVYTPAEVGKLTKFHPAKIREIFVDEPGVIRLGHPAIGRRRQYYTLRIPQSVMERVFGRMTVGG
jgi:hypothetical protein